MRPSSHIPSRLAIAILLAAILLTAAFAPAQNGAANTNSAQAVLHLQVVVVPTVFTPADNQHPSDMPAVTYSVPTVNLKQEIKTEESVLRERLPDEHCLAEPCTGALRTTTVVAR